MKSIIMNNLAHTASRYLALACVSTALLALAVPAQAGEKDDHKYRKDDDKYQKYDHKYVKHSPLVYPPQARPYGKSLTEWISLYWRWILTGSNPDESKIGRVQLMPIPNGELISGSGTPEDPALYRGQLEITIPVGTPLVLPQFAWIGERYNNGSPDDAPIADDILLAGVSTTFTINDRPVITDANKEAYYIPVTPFDPIVEYAAPTDYGSVGAVFFQGVGTVIRALPEGVHRIHLYEPYIIPGFFGTIYDNTWIVRVVRPAHIANPRSRPFGKSYGEWGAKWWQWALSIPADRSPLSDETGEFAGEGQHGPVWFVAGTFGTDAERSFTVPRHKFLFLPVFNWIFGSGVFDCDPTVPGVPCVVEDLQAGAAANTEAAEILNVMIDGLPVPDVRRYRGASPEPFSITYPENSVTEVPAGTYSPNVSDGYWLMIAPLSRGTHEIRVHVSAPDTLFGLIEFTVVHNITVE